MKALVPNHKISLVKQKNKTNMFMKDFEGKDLGFHGEVA
jgi:hypothetical protein